MIYCQYSNHLNTLQVRLSKILVLEWRSDNQIKMSFLWAKMSSFFNGLPNQMIRPFENRTKVSKKFNIQISDVRYSDGYYICHKSLA